MSLVSDITSALTEMMTYSSCSFAIMSGSNQVSCSAYVSYGHNIRYDVDPFDVNKSYEDKSVMVLNTDISTWPTIEPKKTKCWLDNNPFMVGGIITYAADVYTWISLRSYTGK